MKGNYDLVAPFYDKLSTFIFGNSIRNSQRFLTDAITPGSKILIVGGGTGWILEEISVRHPTELQITYVEISAKMIEISKARNKGANKVDFVNESIFDVKLNTQYDVVITPFLFDNFSDMNIDAIINKLSNQLKTSGVWLYADFNERNVSIWQKLILKCMYLFFRLTCSIEATSLVDTESKFEKRGYRMISSKAFYSNFIYSIIYEKVC